jgi:hypothetical protein
MPAETVESCTVIRRFPVARKPKSSLMKVRKRSTAVTGIIAIFISNIGDGPQSSIDT